MEVTLGQLAERWNNVVWGMDPYKGGDVPLLKIAEEDFEALEVTIEMSPHTRLVHSSRRAYGRYKRATQYCKAGPGVRLPNG